METPGRITPQYKAIALAEWESSVNHRFNLAEKNVEGRIINVELLISCFALGWLIRSFWFPNASVFLCCLSLELSQFPFHEILSFFLN